MKRTCADFLKKVPVKPGEKVLCAVSGGGDSVALLRIMLDAAETLGISLCAGHYNHCLRPTADRDEEYVRELCRKWNVPLFCGKGDVKGQAAGASLEETARDMRYDFLQKTAREQNCAWIATAHNQDDVLETVLLNLARGSGARGLAGIPPVRDNIIRPLLTFSGESLRSFLRERGIEYMQDETNLQDICARNALRLRAVPVLREINPAAAKNAAMAAERLRQDQDFILQEAEKELAATTVQVEQVRFPADRLRDMHPAKAARVVQLLCEKFDVVPGAEHIRAVLELCRSSSPSAKTHLPGKLQVQRQYEDVVFSAKKPENTLKETELTPGETEILPGVTILLEQGRRIYNSEKTFYLACDTMSHKLAVRPRQTGDRIKLPGRPGKSLKKLFVEEKIPRETREKLPVITVDGVPAAVLPLGVDESFVPGENQETVTLVLRGL